MSNQKQPNLSQDALLHRFREYVVAGIALIIGLGVVIMMTVALQSTANAEALGTRSGFIWDYFYRDNNVQAAQVAPLEESQIFLPLINRSGGESIPAQIVSISGYSDIEQTETDFRVSLFYHNGEATYDIYLDNNVNAYKICANVSTSASGQSEVSCDLSDVAGGLLPPGLYDLVSTVSGATSPWVAVADSQVEIIATAAPELRFVAGDNHWMVGSTTQIELVAHQVIDEPFTLALFNKDNNLVRNIASGLNATAGNIDWTVDDVAGCDATNGTPCYLRTLKNDGSVYAELEVYINQPVQPPPPIEPPPPPIGQVRISSISGYSNIEQTETDFRVGLSNHVGGTYDIYLADSSYAYLICPNVPTTVQGDADVSCDLSAVAGLIPPGLYDLYSTATGTVSPLVAIDEFQVEIIGINPTLRFVNGNNRWAVGEATQIELIAHQVPDQPFRLALYRSNGTTIVTNIATSLDATADPVDWTVDDVTGCDIRSGTPCFLRTLRNDNSIYAEVEVYINLPELILVPDTQPYAQGQTLRVLLRNHTPGSVYDVFIQGGSLSTSTPLKLGTTLETNAFGDTPYAIAWTIPFPSGCGSFGWKNGIYDIVSRPERQTTEIAKKENVEFFTQQYPYLTTDGGRIWQAGSTISIYVYSHDSNADHYLEFDQNRVPTSNASDTFRTDDCGYAVVDYEIPGDTPDGNYKIISYLDSNNTEQAEFDLAVLAN